MRKIIITIFMLSALVSANAQFYGEVLYSHPTSSLSSGGVTNINSTGFLMASFAPTFTNASMIYNFVIDKTDDNGDFTGGADFSNGYSTSGATGCSGSVSATGNCAGVSVIEINAFTTNTGVDAWYALAGANSNGPFFALLDNVGAPLIAMDYNPNASMSSISKPLIVECTTTPNNFFICGQINGQVYVIKVDGTGSQVWSQFYRTDPVLRPQAIIECPYTGDLVIVGLATFPVSYNRATDGFFLTVDPSNGNPNIFNTYGHPVGACNEFYSIAIANSTTGGSDGFFIGGWSDPVAGNGNGWFLKLDPSGNIVWDKLIEPTSAIGPVVGVFERLNTSSNYEYYGVGISFNGYMVAKLDDGGTPFSGGNNEFWYDAPALNWSDPNSLSNIVSGGPSPNEGLQVYGTERLVTGGDSYMVSAYFNGVSGCEAGLTNLVNEEDGPDDIIQPQITPIQGLNDCGGFSLNYSPLSTNPNYICGPANSVGGGSNARHSQLKNGETSKDIISLYPNPSNGVFNLQINNSIYNGEILIYNNLGQIVYSQKVDAGMNSIRSAQLSTGVYHYTVSENGSLIHTGKLVIE